MAIAIDTLAYARRLREAGFTEQQAEGQAEALAAAMTDTLATKVDLQALATKDDLREMEARLEARLETRFDARLDARLSELERRIDLRMDARLADLERRMTMRLGGIMVAGIGFMSALAKLT
jgi:predicted nuclease with TOPRIM domain